jgi:hypothetical protein
VDGPGTRDPHDVLGVAAGATPDELTSAYRREARRWHPDHAPEEDAGERMVEINAAYELLRSGLWQESRRPRRGAAPASRPGDHLPRAVRAALGAELLSALTPGEKIILVTPMATWTSPQSLLAVTDSRLLWLLDDAPVHRVRFARYRDLAHIEIRRPRLRRDTREIRARTHAGRRLSFGELRPATADAVVAYARKAGVRLPDYS